MKRIGVIGIPGGWSSEQLAEAFRQRGAESAVIDMAHVACELDGAGGRLQAPGLDRPDALVIKKIGKPYSADMQNRLALLGDQAAAGLRIYSQPDAVRLALDRLTGTLRLARGGIPIPPTVVTENVDVAVDVLRRFETAVLKPLYTSKARGMVKVEPEDDLRERVVQFQEQGNRQVYIQKLVPLPGRDLGVVFLGGEYVGCYARVGDALSWNTTTHSGGRYEAHEPDKEIVELARRAQALFGLDFTCVDVAQSTTGPVVFEVSAFGGFRGLLEACGIDAAARYADYVLNRLQEP